MCDLCCFVVASRLILSVISFFNRQPRLSLRCLLTFRSVYGVPSILLAQFLVNWFYSALSFLGLYNKKGNIIFLGLDCAGKSTLLGMLRDNKLGVHIPTAHAQQQTLVIDKVTFKTHDLGGHKAARRLWREYFPVVDGVVFIVDAAQPERFPEAQTELAQLLGDDLLKNVPFLILGNKIDKKTAVDKDTLKVELNVANACTGEQKGQNDQGVRPMEVYMCSVVARAGYGEGFRWLSQYME